MTDLSTVMRLMLTADTVVLILGFGAVERVVTN